jgi:hypothetical protein
MTGTAWTKPGKGATVGEFLDSLLHAKADWRSSWTARYHLGELGRVRHGFNEAQKTNLSLTGAPLTAEDLRRIETCVTHPIAPTEGEGK